MTETVQTALEAPGPATTENCPTCCTPRTGSYCSECGQRFRAGRLTLVRMAADVLASTFDLDRGMPLTTVALFRRPGQVVRAFVNGATGRYTSPAKYLIVWAAVGAVVYLQLGWIRPGSGQHGAVYIARDYLSLVLVARVPVASLLSRALFRRAGFNVAEHLVFNAYATAQTLLILTATAPMALLVGLPMEAYAALLVASAFVYYAWAAADFFRLGVAGDLVRAGLVQAAVVLLYVVLLGFGTGAL